VTDLSHREPITQVVWHFNRAEAARHSNREAAYQLITFGTDGRVLIWLWSKLDIPVYGYELQRAQPDSGKLVTWGATAVAFFGGGGGSSGSRSALGGGSGGGGGGADAAAAAAAAALAEEEERGSFVIGTDGGPIFKCLLQHNASMQEEFQKAHLPQAQSAGGTVVAASGGPKLRSPIKSEYRSHAGVVYGLECSPYQRNVFASCGSDGALRVYSTLQTKPILALEPSSAYLFCCQWSPFRPTVLAAGTGAGKLVFYDMMQSTLHPARCVDATEQLSPVHALAFNPKLPEFLASTDGETVKVWELGPRLTENRPGEQRLLDRLTELDAAEALFDM